MVFDLSPSLYLFFFCAKAKRPFKFKITRKFSGHIPIAFLLLRSRRSGLGTVYLLFHFVIFVDFKTIFETFEQQTYFL